MRRAASLLLAVLVTAGCHSYRPVSEAPEPGTDVRVRLTAPGALELSRQTDDAVRSYEGELLESGPDTLNLSVVLARNVSDFQRSGTLRNNFLIPRDYVERLEVRELSGWRTALVSGAAAGIAGFLVYRAAGGGGGTNQDPDDNGTIQSSRIPFGIPLP